jgi:hypothetical protein
MGALVDEPVRCERDDERVTHRLCFLEIPQVTDVEQVENAVAMDDALTPCSWLLKQCRHFAK